MKKIILLFIFFFAVKNYSQTRGITYQAVLLNPSINQTKGANQDLPLMDKLICMQFKFVDESSNIEYQEVVQTKTDQYGMVNLIIGKGLKTGGYATSFENILWTSFGKKLSVGVNIDGSCSSFVEISSQDFNYVPYAFSSINAENVTGVVAIENGGTNAITVLGAKKNLEIHNVDNTRDIDKVVSKPSAFISRQLSNCAILFWIISVYVTGDAPAQQGMKKSCIKFYFILFVVSFNS